MVSLLSFVTVAARGAALANRVRYVCCSWRLREASPHCTKTLNDTSRVEGHGDGPSEAFAVLPGMDIGSMSRQLNLIPSRDMMG